MFAHCVDAGKQFALKNSHKIHAIYPLARCITNMLKYLHLNRLASLPQGMKRIFGGYFFMAKVTYTKPYRSVAQLIELLKARGLVFDGDEDAARRYLSCVNYYRFTGYALPFLASREQFYAGTKFSYLYAVYLFDRRLRDLLADALEAVELTFRCLFARSFSKTHGPLGYRSVASFPPSHSLDLQNILGKLDAEFERSDEICAKHFRDSYNAPPLWSVVEVASFGALVRLYRICYPVDQNAVSSSYGFRGDVLASYLQHLVVLRNLCAHHCRMYDRRFSYRFPKPITWRGIPNVDTATLFCQFALVYRLLKPTDASIFDRDAWRTELCEFLRTMPTNPISDHRARAGLPPIPEDSPLW